jgi:glycosyltransferase involved in cell wall biosynthesis
MKDKVLYLSYTGMMEPLGSSQVLNYLYGLSEEYTFYLISLEKEKDFLDIPKKEHLKRILNQKNIHWYPLLYNVGMKGYLSNFRKVKKLAKEILKINSISLVHCRSYMPAIIVYLLQKKNKKIQYIFDTRGFWFDEKVDIGDWSKTGIMYQLAKKIEKKLYFSSSHIVMLSHCGKETILKNELFSQGNKLKNITVIPTCVNLDQFNTESKPSKRKLTIGYIGTAIGWYNFEKTAELLSVIKKEVDYNLLIFNGGQHDYIKQELAKFGITNYHLEKVSFNDMPKRMKEIDISIFFIHPFFSKRASAATKLGELLATGIPVITNGCVGDHEYYINQYSAGKIIDINKIDIYDFSEIIDDLNTEECRKRCRGVAEKYFSLEKGVENYKEIYQINLNKDGKCRN